MLAGLPVVGVCQLQRPHSQLRVYTCARQAYGFAARTKHIAASSTGLFAWGDGKDSNKAPRKEDAECERSSLVNEETVYFIFQLDLDTQLQRCLNYEAYEQAHEVRKKRERVSDLSCHGARLSADFRCPAAYLIAHSGCPPLFLNRLTRRYKA